MLKNILAGAVLAASVGTSPFAAEMGAVDKPIRLAINEWTGQHITTRIAGAMLEAAGYKVEYVTAGMMNQFQAMADGDISAALELWSSNLSDQFGALEAEGKVVDVSDLGLEAREGFAYPPHVAALCPGLPDYQALKDCAIAFATAETVPMGRLVDYPAEWGTPGSDRIGGLELPFKAVPAGSEGALIAEIRASIEKQSPVLVVFWRPHWAFDAFDLTFVEMPTGEPACFDDPAWGPNPNATFDCDFTPTRIFKGAWAGFQETWPAAYEIIDNYRLSTSDQEAMMGAVDVDGRPVEEVVAEWVAAHEAEWRPVVDAAVN